MEMIRYERELYGPVRDFLIRQGFTVRGEVGSCDVAAARGEELIVVELKRHLSFNLLAQAVERQTYSDYVYLAVPKSGDFKEDKEWRAKLRVLKRLGLGLLLVSKNEKTYLVEEALLPDSPGGLRRAKKKRTSIVRELSARRTDGNIGGTRGVPLLTAYREAALKLAVLIDMHGPMKPKELREKGGHEKKTTSILNANFYGWFEREEDGRYALTTAGKDALATYERAVSVFRMDRIPEEKSTPVQTDVPKQSRAKKRKPADRTT